MRFLRMVIASALVGAAFMALSGNALANSAPSAKVTDSSVTPTVIGAKASANDIATGKVTVLAYGQAKGLTKSQMKKASRCYTLLVGTIFINSGKDSSGHWRYFSDKAKAGQNRFCVFKDKQGKQYTLKVNCGNRAHAGIPPAKLKIIHGRVLLVRSFANVKVELKAKVAVRVTAVCGWAEARAEATSVVTLRQYVKGAGPVITGLYAQLTGQATAKASAQLSCVTAPVPPPPTPTPPPPPPPVTPPPPAVCPPGQTGTPPNCKVPPPNTYSAYGQTSVQDQKTLYEYCPPPNQSIQKSGSGSAVLNSPVFTETSTVSQADAQRKLDDRLATWRNQNQSVVDAQAQSKAQSNLSNALLSCPAPPSNRPPTVSIAGPQHVFVNGTVMYCVTASDPDGDALSFLYTTSFGSITGSGSCYVYQGPSSPGTATITVYVNDGRGGAANASITFPIVIDQF